MKNISILFFYLLVVGCEVENNNDLNYDSKWETLPAPVASDSMVKHDDVFFVNEQKGWLVTRNGQIYNTLDGGKSWNLQFEDDIYWRCVGFADELHGWAGNKLGDNNGKLLYQTTDGGNTWSEHVFYTAGQSAEFGGYSTQGIGFINKDIGWMGSYVKQPTLMTLDGGVTWSESDFGAHVNRIRFLSNNLGYASGKTVYKYASD